MVGVSSWEDDNGPISWPRLQARHRPSSRAGHRPPVKRGGHERGLSLMQWCPAPLDCIKDPELRTGALEMFNTAAEDLRNGNLDVIVLTSRRLGCIYQMLVNCDADPFEGDRRVVLDRIVQVYPASFWADKRVRVLDDSVVLGTTIHGLHADLTKLGATVSTRSCVVDVDQVAGYLLEGCDFSAEQERRTSEVAAFSAQLVAGMYRAGVPFFSDFPSIRPAVLTSSQWVNMLASPRWCAADVTPAIFDETRSQSFSLLPRKRTFDEVLARLPSAAADLVSLFKVRTFLPRVGDELCVVDGQDVADKLEVVVVPLVLLAPARVSELQAALESLTANRPQSLGVRLQDHPFEPPALQRLVQMLLTSAVVTEVWPDLTGSAFDPSRLERRQFELHFGSLTEPVLDAYVGVGAAFAEAPINLDYQRPVRLTRTPSSPLLQRSNTNDVLWNARELIATCDLPEEPSEGVAAKIGLIFSQAIVSFFGDLNFAEIEDRQRIRALADIDAYQENDCFERRLLRQHVSFLDLENALLPDSLGSFWRHCLLSLGLDIGNDMGVIVPETRFDPVTGIVYRCYRLGEGASLADSPLSLAVHTGRYDAMTRAALKHGPLRSRNIDPASKDEKSVPVEEPHDAAELARMVTKVVPGTLLRRYDATITEVDDDVALARLETSEGAVYYREVSLDVLSPRDRQRAQVGARFSYSTYSGDPQEGNSTVTIKIRFRPTQFPDTEAVERRAAALAKLFE